MTSVELPAAFRYALSQRFLAEQSSFRPRISHHASDAEACLRQLWYAWKSVPPDNLGKGSQFAPIVGGRDEGVMGDILRAALPYSIITQQLAVAVRVEGHELRGKVDFRLEMSNDEWVSFFPQYSRAPVPLEVKSLGTDKYMDAVLRGPIRQHLGQLNVYTCTMGAPFGLLTYVQREAKDTVPFTVWLYPANAVRFALVLERLKRLEQYLQLDIVPPPLCPEGKLDQLCPWSGARCPKDGGWPPSSCPVCAMPHPSPQHSHPELEA